MNLEQSNLHLVGDRVLNISPSNQLCSAPEHESQQIKELTKKERALRFQGFVIVNSRGEIIFEDPKRYALHFFPLSILDYIRAMYQFERNGVPIPILSVDSHDVLGCDFNCLDCLSAHGTNFPVEQFPKGNFRMDLK